MQEVDIIEPFSLFIKILEDCMGIIEAARASCADAQINNKVFSALLESDMFHHGVR